MSVHYQIDYEKDILHETIDGVITDKDAHQAIHNHINYNNSHSGMKMFTNIQDAKIQVTTKCVVDIARTARDFYSNYRGTKWAIYTENKYNYGIARMFASICTSINFSVKVFKDKQSALEWLNS